MINVYDTTRYLIYTKFTNIIIASHGCSSSPSVRCWSVRHPIITMKSPKGKINREKDGYGREEY